MRTFHIARTLDDWRTLTGQTVRFHTYRDPDREEPGDHRGVIHGVGTFDGVVRVVLDSGFVDVDLATVVEVIDREDEPRAHTLTASDVERIEEAGMAPHAPFIEALTEAERVAARFDTYTQEEHREGIEAARRRAAAKRDAD